MRRIIDSDQLRDRYDFKLFRGIPYFLIGLAIARLQGYLYYVPGLWILGVAAWAVLICASIPMLITAYFNIQRGIDWYEGFDPEKLMLLGIVAIALLTGISLEAYRVGG